MKKLICFICVITTILLTGCEKQSALPDSTDSASSLENNNVVGESNTSGPVNGESEALQKLTDLNAGLEGQINAVRSAGYKNINLTDDFTAAVPNVDKIYDISLTRKELTFEECYKMFDAFFDDAFGGIYSEEDKKELYHASAHYDELGGYGSDSSRLCNHFERFMNGELILNELYVDTHEVYLSVLNVGGGAHAIDTGDLRRRVQSDTEYKTVAMTFATNYYDIVANYLDCNSNASYMLLDKEMPVKDAADYVKQKVADKGYSSTGDLVPEVSQVVVLDIGEGKYGYSFTMASSYKGVPIDVYEMFDNSGFSTYTRQLNHNYVFYPMRIFMMESENIATIYGGRGNYDVSEIKEYDSVISFDDAARMLSEKIAGGMRLEVSRADLLYAQYNLDDNDHYEFNLATEPVWKFRCHNSVDDLKYIIYINAIDGSVEYYTTEWVDI